MAIPMKMNPRKVTVGPTTMRRVEKISGLNAVSVDPGPHISKKPIIIVAAATAIRMKLIRTNGIWCSLSRSMRSAGFFFFVRVFFAIIYMYMDEILFEHIVVTKTQILVGSQ